ncbi:5'-nucleotidase C-terminal domain-containing protein [Terribacillus sp. 7520-G]|uniref:5'-nucleotidase C-terminal domain-containing protein n=1 Tax=Terribacillus sp. 7520-G TaxID=2025389 RepID=UPI001E5A735A|nr:5'-nucleotidase C-terminal domain-containing protein [Terribacillus sp. 7520-G]
MGKRAVSVFAIVALICSGIMPGFASVSQAAEHIAAPILSEYAEGSSYDKAIELYNPTDEPIDLSQFELAGYFNGNTKATASFTLSGTLAPADTYVIVNPRASEALLAKADQTNGSVINFNGNDAVALQKDGAILDVVGEIGNDQDTAKDIGLIRSADVTEGSPAFVSEQWEETAKDAFETIGSHGQEPPADEPGEEPEPGEVQSIADIKSETGETVTVEGIATADNGSIGGGKLSVYIQDDTAGINIYHADEAAFPEVKEGDLIRVTGEITNYRGLTEIAPEADGMTVISQDNELPLPKELTISQLQAEETAEPAEGKLVRVSGYIKDIPESPAGGGYNIQFINENYESVTLRIMESAMDMSAVEEGKWYTVTGILSQYDSYQILPRKQEDMQAAQEQPEPPKAEGEYTAIVESVTDGDTIRLQEPVLGSDRVRFVNADTPETFHSVKNELDQNQMDHGKAASDYLKSKLSEGDEITVKVGEEPTDDYGRLLAQVITADGENLNLELVREGLAVTYFIAPIGNEGEYETYQRAVAEAKSQQKGIWRPDSPLEELPFEFRARYDGGGLDKYVGNSDTKQYVVPDQWESIPVDKRIFFWTEQDAIEAGYETAGEMQPPAQEDTLSVQLLGMNDLHGKIDQQYELDTDGDGTADGTFGRMDYTAAAIKQREAENPNSLLVHAGDMIGGSSPVSALLQDEPTIEIMEAMGFDVGTIGNHELDEGIEELLRIVHGGEHPNGTPGYDGMDFPTLCANCVYKDSGETILPPYSIEEVDGEKIGFIGVNTTASLGMVMPEGIQDITITDEVEAVNKAAAELKEKGIKAIVVLSHMPAEQSGDGATGDAAEMANAVDDEVDIIFAAHNHAVVNAMVDDKLIVQASEYGKAFSDVDVEIDRETGDIVSKQAEIVWADQAVLTPDPTVGAILAGYAEEVAPIMDEVVGIAANTMTGGYAVKGEAGDNALGNLIADGMREAMDSDFAMMNGGGIRDDLLEGDITWGELFNIQPFNNTLMTFEIDGADLEEILNAQITSYGPDYSISGFTYTWNGETNQVMDIKLPDGSSIAEDKVYTLTVNNFMGTSQGDKYRPISELGRNPVMGPEDLEATVAFVRGFEMEPIAYEAEGRISEVSGDAPVDPPSGPEEPPADPEEPPADPDHPIADFVKGIIGTVWNWVKQLFWRW